LITNTSKQKAKEWDAKYCIKDAENLPTLCAWSDVAITLKRQESNANEVAAEEDSSIRMLG